MYEAIIKERPLLLIGVLHTHPSSQFVSVADRVYMLNADRFCSRLCCLIAGVRQDELDSGAYVVVNGRIYEIPMVVYET
ncbi:MAG: hypothetical protein ACTSRA_05490 [Promethearchaeota archaeon]